jgi:hypothetical protein
MRLEHWWYTLPLRLRSIFQRAQLDQELDDELRFHLDQQTARGIAAGQTPEQAPAAARRAIDGLDQHKEKCRDARKVNFIVNVGRDFSYAYRSLGRNPGFTAVAVLTLALGIGANTAIYSVVDAALLRPLTYPLADRLILLFELFDQPNVVSCLNFADWQRQSRGFGAMAAGRQNAFNLAGSTAAGGLPPERIPGAVFSWQLFQTLGVQPMLGRAFTADDDRLGAARVAIISYGLWQRRFGGTGDILRRPVRLDGVAYQIIGVMPPGFGYPTRIRVNCWDEAPRRCRCRRSPPTRAAHPCWFCWERWAACC